MRRCMPLMVSAVAIILLFGAFVASEGLLAASISEPEDDSAYLFRDDFSQDEVGSAPSRWELSRTVVDGHGTIEVIEAPELASGKALRVAIHRTDEDKVQISAISPGFLAPEGNAPKVAIDYKMKWIEGNLGMYNYITGDGGHRLILLPKAEEVVWHASLRGIRSQSIGAFYQRGWNHVRVVADRETETAALYLNDMDTPVADGLPFQRPVDTWEDLTIRLMHEIHRTDSGEREMYFGDFKVWTVQ